MPLVQLHDVKKNKVRNKKFEHSYTKSGRKTVKMVKVYRGHFR